MSNFLCSGKIEANRINRRVLRSRYYNLNSKKDLCIVRSEFRFQRAVVLLFAGLLACAVANEDYKIVCYFGSWSVYRSGNGQFKISDIDASLCTHLIYTFIGVTNDGGVRILDPALDVKSGGYQNFTALRYNTPNAKTMIAMGGWNEGSPKYSEVVSSPSKRKNFVKSVLEFLKEHDFDGFDLDWEYPNQRGGKPSDKENFVSLLRELKEAFEGKNLILSAAVGSAETSASQSYLIAKVAKYLDFINLMTYDLHGRWDKKTGINAPLYPASKEQNQDRLLNVDASVNYWISQGAPPKKLVLGVPLYGRSFKLDNPSMNGIGAPASQGANPGPYTNEPGMLGYNEICENLKYKAWKEVFHEEQRVPYAYKGDQWVGYDNERSLEEKADYVKKMGLGGMMVWSLETDDFKGNCGEKYPLLNVINQNLRGKRESNNFVHWHKPGQSHNEPQSGYKASSEHSKKEIELLPTSQLGPRFGSPGHSSPIYPASQPSAFQGSLIHPTRPSHNSIQKFQKPPYIHPSSSPFHPSLSQQVPSQTVVKQPEPYDEEEDHVEDSEELEKPHEREGRGGAEEGGEEFDLVLPHPTEVSQGAASITQETSTKPMKEANNPVSDFIGWKNRIPTEKPVPVDQIRQEVVENQGTGFQRIPESSQKPPNRATVHWPPTQSPPQNPFKPQWPSSQILIQSPQGPILTPSALLQTPAATFLIPQHHLQNPQGYPGFSQNPSLGPLVVSHNPWTGQQILVQNPQYTWAPPQLTRSEPASFDQASPSQIPQQNLPVSLQQTKPEIANSQTSDLSDKIGLCKNVGPVGGYVRDPDQCDVFYQCHLNGEKYRIHEFKCSPPTKFNPTSNSCDHPTNVQC
ncbi:hypothetical protein QAD02_016181 [Eretmocerus hayati]|uniref:Uncharacterized protein n=1 Tax=Eretmocerus hayati TaxID=131215 RepID=A0ACC2P9U6_9HYME|nr:hypothetical protein QAD02_016181 [Eretmocerus hayati]